MQSQVTRPSKLAQALRIALTFLLVFGLSFQTEIALAAKYTAAKDLDVYVESEDKPTDIGVYRVVDGSSLDGDKPLFTTDSKDAVAESDDATEFKFAAVPVWAKAKDGGDVKVVADDSIVEWTVDGVAQATDGGVLTLSIAEGEQKAVVCELSDDAKAEFPDAKGLKVSFTAKYDAADPGEDPKPGDDPDPKPDPEPEPEPDPEPYAAEVSLSCDKITSNAVERLKGEDFDEEGYQFVASVKVYAEPKAEDDDEESADETGDEEASGSETSESEASGSETGGSDADESKENGAGASESKTSDGAYGELLYDSATAEEDLATWSDGKIVPKWEIKFTGDEPRDPDAYATIDQNGLLKVYQDCSLQVWYTIVPPAGETADSFKVDFTTSGKAKEYDQGANKLQESLKLSGYFLADDVDGEEFGGEEGNESEGEEADESPKLYLDDYTNVGEVTEPFAAEDFTELPSYGQNTYQMWSGKDKSVGITGKGATLKDVLDSLFDGISDSDAIEQVKFVDCDGGTVTYNWADLMALNPVIATDSAVHLPESLMDTPSGSADGEEADAADSADAADDDGQTDVDELLKEYGPYTRFRLLYNDAAGSALDVNAVPVDADRLRSINEIVINPQIDPEERPEAPYNLTLSYTPVPIGKVATVDALTTGKLKEANFSWEESSDEGKTWKKLKETSAQYKFKMTQEMVGHIIKVTATSVEDEAIRASDQVTISLPEKTDEIIFALSYRPPIAGDLAFFQTELINGEIDLTTLDYIWEYSEDKKNWTPLPDSYQHKPTLSIQTSKVTDTDDSPDQPLAIRARIVQKTGNDGGPWIAGPVDFWVRSEGEGDDKDDEREPGANEPDGPSGGKKDPNPDPDPKSDPDPDSDADSNSGSKAHKESPEINDETSDYQPINLSNVVIDDEVSEQIIEQEEAAQEAFESTVPGARWTTISAKEGSGNDGRNVFGDNPFAPFAVPVGLGVTVAGGLEKLLFFRRQL